MHARCLHLHSLQELLTASHLARRRRATVGKLAAPSGADHAAAARAGRGARDVYWGYLPAALKMGRGPLCERSAAGVPRHQKRQLEGDHGDPQGARGPARAARDDSFRVSGNPRNIVSQVDPSSSGPHSLARTLANQVDAKNVWVKAGRVEVKGRHKREIAQWLESKGF